jgi:hypothetical protein
MFVSSSIVTGNSCGINFSIASCVFPLLVDRAFLFASKNDVVKILILTQYYPPEIGAPQNRLHELAVRLQANGVAIEVLTALPNYPKMQVQEGYQKRQNREEIIDGIDNLPFRQLGNNSN